MIQFSLISLIPGLLRRLEDCADPEFDSYEKNLVAPTSLRTSERSSRRLSILHKKQFGAYVVSAFLHGVTTAAVCMFSTLYYRIKR